MLVADWRVLGLDRYQFVVVEHHVVAAGAELIALRDAPLAPEVARAVHDAIDLHVTLLHNPLRTSRLRQRREAGLRRGGTIPYGYRLAQESVHLEPDPREQEAIRIAGAMRAEHRSYAQIAAELERLGHLNRRGERMDPRTVANLIAWAKERSQGEEPR